MKARWEQLPPAPSVFSLAGQTHWYVVDEDDEIIATVAGAGQMWTAMVDHGNVNKHGVFISESAAMRKVEKWLSPTYTFQAPATAWVYGVAP